MPYRNTELLSGFLKISRTFSLSLAFRVSLLTYFLHTVLCSIDVKIITIFEFPQRLPTQKLKIFLLLGWQKSLLGFFHKMLLKKKENWKNGTGITSIFAVSFAHSSVIVFVRRELHALHSSSFLSPSVLSSGLFCSVLHGGRKLPS